MTGDPVVPQLTESNMIKSSLTAVTLALAAATSFAQSATAVSMPPQGASSSPAHAASAAKTHKLLQKLKNHKPGQPASNPETSPFKSGGG